MSYRGDFNPSDIVYFNFTTLDISASPAVPFALSGGTVSVYKDDSAAQSTSGVTLTSPFDSVTGLHNVKVDTSADGTFYATGHQFQAILTAGTVNGVSVVGYVLDSFSIGATNRKVDVDTIKTNPVVNGGTITFPTNATVASTTNITAGTIATVTNLTNAPTNGDLTATMKTSVTTAVTGASVNTTQLASQTVTAAAGVTFPTSVASPTNITAGTITTTANLTNAPPDSSGVTTLLARLGAFTGTGINTVLGFFKAIMKKTAASTPSDVGDTFDNTTDSLEAIKDTGLSVAGSVNVSSMDAGVITDTTIASNAITAAKIATDAIGAAQLAADAVTEIQSGLSTLNAAGVRTAVGLATANLDTQLGAIDDYIDTEVAAIKAKTDLIPAAPASTTNITAASGVALTSAYDPAKTAAQAGDAMKLTSDGLDDVAAPADLADDTDARGSFVGMFRALFNRFYNRVNQTATQQRVYADNSTTVVSTLVVSDDSTTQEKGKSS